MNFDEAGRRLEETRREEGLPDDAVLEDWSERYLTLVDEGGEEGAPTVSIVRAWCGRFRIGPGLREHAIDPAGKLIRVRTAGG